MFAKRGASENRISQGDILADIEYYFSVIEGDKYILTSFTLPYVIVMTQDCDLEWDYNTRNDKDRKNDDKVLQSVLVCPAYIAEQVKEGTHLAGMDLQMNTLGGELWKRIKNNSDKRYHYLEADNNIILNNLIVDFKHYYTIPWDNIYNYNESHYLASLEKLFREDLSHRFSHYLSRIGLPKVKKEED